MKKMALTTSLSFFIMLFCSVNFGFGQTTLVKGDIVIIGVNTDNEDFTFVLRTDITVGTTIYFSDNEVNATGTGLNNIGEGLIVFTAATAYSCGTVIGLIKNSTEFTTVNGVFALNNNGDEVLAFQGYNNITRNWTRFLHANVDATIVYPVGFTAADIVDGALDNREYIGNKTNPTWTELNTLANYNESNNYSTVTLETATFTCATCPTTVTWNGSAWLPSAPTLTTAAVINGDYDTSAGGTQTSFSACSLTVNPTFNLTVSNGDYVEVENDVVANGGVIVQSQANFIQHSDTALFTDNSGGGVVLSKTKTLQRWYSYTYWSSPVQNETIETVLGNTPVDRRFTYNAANFVDLLAEIGNTNTFTLGADGLDDNGDDWVNIPTGSMVPGIGYAATASQFGPAFPRIEQFNFYGAFNNGEVLVPLVSNSGGAYEDWNLVGNPYPCAINAIDFLTYNSAFIGALYLWDQSTPPSSANSGSQNSNFSSDDYATINGSGGIAATSNPLNIPNDFIPSGQGFFVNAAAAGNLTFNNSMRAITNDNSQFFKSTKTKSKVSNSSANKLWVNLTSDNGVFNQILVSYINGATNADDGDFYDAPRNLSSINSTSLYSVIESDNSKFAIQGKDANSINEDEIIKLGFKSTINVPTLFKLSVAQLEGDFLTNNSIFLIDYLLNKVHDLSVCDYTFTSAVGEFNSRFEIAFTNKTLAVNDVIKRTNALTIIALQDDFVQFNTSAHLKIKAVNIYDLLGRELYRFKGENTSETYKLSNLKNTVYIAKVALSDGTVVTKKTVKK